MNSFLVKCRCQHCNQHIEFEAARSGEMVTCPGCGMETTLFVPPRSEYLSRSKKRPDDISFDRTRVMIICGIILLFSFLCFLGGMMDKENEFNPFVMLFFGLVMGILYFAPALVATRKRQFPALFALNFLLGWTILGWAGALVWAMIKEKEEP